MKVYKVKVGELYHRGGTMKNWLSKKGKTWSTAQHVSTFLSQYCSSKYISNVDSKGNTIRSTCIQINIPKEWELIELDFETGQTKSYNAAEWKLERLTADKRNKNNTIILPNKR